MTPYKIRLVAQRPHDLMIEMKDTKTGVLSTEAKFILMFISLHSNVLDTGGYMYIPVSLAHSQSTPLAGAKSACLKNNP